MNRITQHIAAFHTGPEPQTAEFATTEELLAVPFVAQWAETTDGLPFYRFSVSEGRMLMVEYGDGQKHYVVGFLASMHGVDLPTWVYTPRQTSLSVGSA